MRNNLPPGARRVEDAPCGCERYEFDAHDAEGGRLPDPGVVALHVDACEFSGKRFLTNKDGTADLNPKTAKKPVRAAKK